MKITSVELESAVSEMKELMTHRHDTPDTHECCMCEFWTGLADSTEWEKLMVATLQSNDLIHFLTQTPLREELIAYVTHISGTMMCIGIMIGRKQMLNEEVLGGKQVGEPQNKADL